MKRTIMSDPNITSNGSSNKRSKPQSQPLHIPAGHVAFRLLCHMSRIGGVIGKAGTVIKQLQLTTGAKIRIEEPPKDTTDRVVTVIGPVTADTKLRVAGGVCMVVNSIDNGIVGDDYVAVSKAQEGLIRVFERILAVAAESGLLEMGVVSCRLLAEKNQVGSIIGKGGKVVEQIRKETGSRIKVLNENLSACAGIHDEIVEIEGDVLAVKKALVAVSQRLQDCPSADKSKVIGGRSLEVIPPHTVHRSLEAVPQEILAQRPIEVIPHDSTRKHVEALSLDALRRPIESFHPTLPRTVPAIPLETVGRSFGIVSQQTLPDLSIDFLSNRNSIAKNSTSSSISYGSGFHSSSLESRKVPPPMSYGSEFHTSSLGSEKVLSSASYGSRFHSSSLESEKIMPSTSYGSGFFHSSSLESKKAPPHISYGSGFHSSSMESEKVAPQQSQQQEVSFRILGANDRVGGVIGKGGNIIKTLQSETGASITVGANVAECDERLITIAASENPKSPYSPAQKATCLVFARLIEAGDKGLDSNSNNGLSVTARLLVASNQVGCLLGKGGTIISEMRKFTGTNIKILGDDQLPKCARENDKVVQILGEFSKVNDAIYNITSKLRENIFTYAQINAGTRNNSSMLIETNQYGRLRDPVSIGMHSSTVVSHSHNSVSPMGHTGFSSSVDHPPSPRIWTSQTVSGVNSRNMTDANRGSTYHKGGLELGSGSKSAIVTNSTVEIVVPENVIGSVYGENGSNLTRLRQISGAKVIVHEPRLGSTDRIVVISGTPDETQAAQSLLQAFILTGPS